MKVCDVLQANEDLVEDPMGVCGSEAPNIFFDPSEAPKILLTQESIYLTTNK